MGHESFKQLRELFSALRGYDGDKSPLFFFFVSSWLGGSRIMYCVIIINFVPLVIASIYIFYLHKFCTFILNQIPILILAAFMYYNLDTCHTT